ncbi:unnamed protein product [Periconia digitata]|uniref:Tudor domain-containing protein n=1 Tax=Periconia digitata TaxID=1303443 RepID=A0A9W4U2V6_9PLEO|nr:unnamed protein product [Periconia digitata]
MSSVPLSDKGKDNKTGEPPQSRAPDAHVTENPNATNTYGQRYNKGDVVWVEKKADGQQYKATVVDARQSGSGWEYHCRDSDGKSLWVEGFEWIKSRDMINAKG